MARVPENRIVYMRNIKGVNGAPDNAEIYSMKDDGRQDPPDVALESRSTGRSSPG